jgi:metal-responsive CopG/Arc/MetJ family transcriptional regulator
MARQRMNFEIVSARFPKNTFARIQKVLKKDEPQSEFIRQAVQTKIEARERGRKQGD